MFSSLLSKITIVLALIIAYIATAIFYMLSTETSARTSSDVSSSTQTAQSAVLLPVETDVVATDASANSATSVSSETAIYVAEDVKEVVVEGTIVPTLDATAAGYTDPYLKPFTWSYSGQNYAMDVQLYGSLYGYYFNSPKVFSYRGTPPANWEELYFSMFLQTAPNDTTIDVLAQQIQSLGRARGLNDDQIVELTAAFVQAIPYDTPKAQRILSNADLTDGTMVYPYETLWQNTGVCSDKSILLYMLLQSLGYGAALLTYESEQHMAVGVQCSPQYASYDNGYCYIETTTTMPIGMIPSLDADNRATAALALHTGGGGVFDASRSLGAVATYAPTTGTVYTGIVQTRALVDEINALSISLGAQEQKIASKQEMIKDLQEEISDMADRMSDYKDDKEYDKYNALVDEYNDLISTYEDEVEKFNDRIDIYNADVNRYNALVNMITTT